MVCTGCGAEANASCNCGKPYEPKAVRAAEAVKATPEKSDRAIAAEIGVDHKTVGAARKELTGENSPVERIGLDGKTRKMPQRDEPHAAVESTGDLERDKEQFIALAAKADRAAKRSLVAASKFSIKTANNLAQMVKHEMLPADHEAIAICGRVAKAWCELAERMHEHIASRKAGADSRNDDPPAA
jgi:hypothetical protein